jgi:hypothetical protein
MKTQNGLWMLSMLAAILVISAGCQSQKTYLYNGKDLTGLTPYPADANHWMAKGDVLYSTGKPFGYIRTEKVYQDFKLHVEWRWPAEPTNSGVFLFINGEDTTFPRCIEAQLKHLSAGDFVIMNHSGATVKGVRYEDATKQFIGVKKYQETSEKPLGEWNSYDIICKGDSIQLFVNNVLQNEATKTTESSGWIGLQSEGGPIEFRNVYIEPLK